MKTCNCPSYEHMVSCPYFVKPLTDAEIRFVRFAADNWWWITIIVLVLVLT